MRWAHKAELMEQTQRQTLPRLALLAAAAACLTAAFGLVIHAGLPERAVFTGQMLSGSLYAPEIGANAPPFEAVTAAGEQLRLDDLRGQAVLLNFWATWCEPCRVEMPILQAIAARHSNNVRVVAVNLGETPDAVRAWADDLGLTFDLALDQSGRIAALYRLRGQPSTYVLSPAGTITHIYYGPATESALLAALAPFMLDTPGSPG